MLVVRGLLRLLPKLLLACRRGIFYFFQQRERGRSISATLALPLDLARTTDLFP
jgi:hypothetical protein